MCPAAGNGSSYDHTALIAIAFVRAVGDVIRPLQLREINILPWNVLNGRIHRFAKRQGVAAIGHHATGDGYENASGIALDGNRVIRTWKSYRFFLHVLGFHFPFSAQVFRRQWRVMHR
jgi:hypothetical protein